MFHTRPGDNLFKWKIHRHVAKHKFATAAAAAGDLSGRLGVAVHHLKTAFQGNVPKPPLTPSLNAFTSLLWHPKKVGWYSRTHRQYHLSPHAAVKAGKLKKRRVKPTEPNPGVLRRYKGVVFNQATKRWLAQSFDKATGTWRQVHGIFHTEKGAADALAKWMGKDTKDLEKGAKGQRRSDILKHIKAVMKIYQNMPMEHSLPGDLSDLLMNRNEDEELDPEVRHFIIQMKYAPYRKVVREVGKATKKETKTFVWKSFVKRCLQGFAKIHLDVLRPWRQSVGKSVSHHHGMLAFMHTFGALRKLKQKPRKVGEDHPP